MKTWLLSGFVVIAILVGGFSSPSYAATDGLAIRSVGLFDEDGTVLYSVLLATTEEASLQDLIITTVIPENTTFVEVVAAPPDAILISSKDGVTWMLSQLPAATVTGPFTYRVQPNDASQSVPDSVPVSVAWGGVFNFYEPTTTDLIPLAESATLTVTPNGTLNANGENDVVSLDEIGVTLYIPANAVSESTTLTITHLPFDAVPNDDGETWWCSLFSITSDPTVEFSQPIILSVPTRQTLTAGMAGQVFTYFGTWQEATVTSFIAPDGKHAIISNLMLLPSQQIAVGVKTLDRNTSTVTADTIQTQITDGTSNTIVDGTSNTVVQQALPYIEQDNIIAILIGKK